MKKTHFLMVILSLCVFAPFAYAAFSDVKSTNVNYDAINYVQSQQIVQGYSDGTYGPDININRAEFTKIIINAVYSSSDIDGCIQKEVEATNGVAFFPDVPKTEWFAKYVCLAKVNGIISGYPDGTFKPANDIKFVEAAKIIVNGFKYQAGSDAIWYKPFVTVLAGKNAIPTTITGFEKLITRGEMAEMIYRLKAGITNKDSATYATLANGNVNLNLMLFFGKDANNIATESFPIYTRNCFTTDSSCQTKQLYGNEWTLNTKDRLAFDPARGRIVFPMAAGVFQLNFFDTSTKNTSSTGLENNYSISYEPAISGNTLAAAVFTMDGKETVIKYDLSNDKETAVTGFSSYDKCTWPAVSGDEKVWAVCNKGSTYKIVDENNTELYSSSNELKSLAADASNLYFVENSQVKKITIADKNVATLAIPSEDKVSTVTSSPFGDYIGGKAQKNGNWLIFVFKPADNSFVVQTELDQEPGIPVFGPIVAG
jgi:hypothetical protein